MMQTPHSEHCAVGMVDRGSEEDGQVLTSKCLWRCRKSLRLPEVKNSVMKLMHLCSLSCQAR